MRRLCKGIIVGLVFVSGIMVGVEHQLQPQIAHGEKSTLICEEVEAVTDTAPPGEEPELLAFFLQLFRQIFYESVPEAFSEMHVAQLNGSQ